VIPPAHHINPIMSQHRHGSAKAFDERHVKRAPTEVVDQKPTIPPRSAFKRRHGRGYPLTRPTILFCVKLSPCQGQSNPQRIVVVLVWHIQFLS
jgi:hypothetical protein